MAESQTSIAVAGALYGLWGAGKLMGDEAVANMAPLVHEEVVLDVACTLKNTDAYKVYNGYQGMKDWVEFLLSFDFVDFKPDLYDAGEGRIFGQHTGVQTHKGTGKAISLHDMVEIKVVDGKVKFFKIFWGNPDAMDAQLV
eukprot:CAMPEP_0174954300 /NCGR_PEP_ID=MMETSP0004_2-20121128/346_1 /TAXON_ID=420556 /ORGANISM="Ochromonas sp., Strain CCMP1393" /LENGTH=140 /DNA_ID=CAMNT_0016202095 /DNA_START=53 /DNA_END=475 /DNA_ORIENTATION=-